MIDYLFICSQNWMRSPTAEHVARSLGYKAISAGTDLDAVRTVTVEDVERSDRVICMEQHHAKQVTYVAGLQAVIGKIDVWDILDMYDYCQPELIEIIRMKMGEKPKG